MRQPMQRGELCSCWNRLRRRRKQPCLVRAVTTANRPYPNHPPPCNIGSRPFAGGPSAAGLALKGIPLEDRRSKRYPSSWRTIRAGAGRSIPRAVRSDGRPRSRPRGLDARNSFSAASVFVADDQGHPLVWEFSGGGDLLTAAAPLGDAVQRARRHLPEELGAEVVHLALAPDQVLSLISAATPLGTWQAGLTTSSPRTPRAVRMVVRAL